MTFVKLNIPKKGVAGVLIAVTSETTMNIVIGQYTWYVMNPILIKALVVRGHLWWG